MTIRGTRRLVPVLVLLLVACVPSNALAFWGWIEELSGPGPFRGLQYPIDRLAGCVIREKSLKDGSPGETKWISPYGRGKTEQDSLDKLECLRDGSRVAAYIALEIFKGKSHGDNRFPRVAFTAYKPIIYYRLQESVDVGVGIGFNRFSGDGFHDTGFAGKSFAFWRLSVPLRVRFYAPGLKSGSRYRGFFFAVQTDYFSDFSTADFMAPDGPRIDSGFVPSAFLGIDVLTLWKGVR